MIVATPMGSNLIFLFHLDSSLSIAYLFNDDYFGDKICLIYLGFVAVLKLHKFSMMPGF